MAVSELAVGAVPFGDTAEAIARRIELLAQRLGNARKNIDVLDNDEREPLIAGIDERGSRRNFRITLSGLFLSNSN